MFHILRNARVTARARGSEARRVLGRPRDRARGVRLHEEGRLRARPRGSRHLHGLRRRRDEGPDEGRDRRATRSSGIRDGRYIGLTEPTIIAAESPNPIVNELVIMPDMEKRLEAFVRMAHAIIVFPGGVGTAEEILYLLGILLNPENDARAVAAGLHRALVEQALFRASARVHRRYARSSRAARYKVVLGDPAGGCPRGHARARRGASRARAARQPVLLQLGAEHRHRFSAAFRGDARRR